MKKFILSVIGACMLFTHTVLAETTQRTAAQTASNSGIGAIQIVIAVMAIVFVSASSAVSILILKKYKQMEADRLSGKDRPGD